MGKAWDGEIQTEGVLAGPWELLRQRGCRTSPAPKTRFKAAELMPEQRNKKGTGLKRGRVPTPPVVAGPEEEEPEEFNPVRS